MENLPTKKLNGEACIPRGAIFKYLQLKSNLNRCSLTLKDPFISESCIEIRIELNFHFHTSLRCLKRFYERLKGLHKTFLGTTKNCENKNLNNKNDKI